MNTKPRFLIAAICFFGFFHAIVALAQAQTVPALINYQGKLVNSNGLPVSTGDYPLSFRIYDAALSGNLVWGPQVFNGQTGPGYGPLVAVVQGWFNVMLGPVDTNGIAINTAFSAPDRFLEIQIGTNSPFSPRQRILSAPFALRADIAATAQIAAMANSVSDGSITGAKIAAGAVGSTQLGAGAVQGSNIANGAVGPLQVSVGGIGSAQIATGAVQLAHLAPGMLPFIPQHIEVFTSSGTWTKPANVSRIYVKVWGAGGGGGGGFRQFNGSLPNFGGGGGGGYSEGFLNVTANATIVIGTGGAGAITSGLNPAAQGGTSSIVGDMTIQATGGSGGGDLSLVATGGLGSGGLINLSGTPSRGSEGGSAPNPQYDGAVGGGRGTSSGSGGVNDIGGRGYGGAGAGGTATSGSSGSWSYGGNGANGLIMIYY